MEMLYKFFSEQTLRLVYIRLVVAGAIIIAFALDFSTKVERLFADKDAWQITTQFFFIAVLGGAVTVAYRHWENERIEERRRQDAERERRTVQRDALIEFFHSAVGLQHEYKKIRRTLRAVSFVDEDTNRRLIERREFENLYG